MTTVTGWLVLRDDEHELYRVLLELREDGVIVLHRHRVDRRTGTQYGDFIKIAVPRRRVGTTPGTHPPGSVENPGERRTDHDNRL
jgi:hypothetical protein